MIKTEILEVKNTMAEVNNSIERPHQAGEAIDKLKDRSLETVQTMDQKENKMKNNEESL
jgi:hypothetical protein